MRRAPTTMGFLSRLKIRQLLFLMLLLSGIVPLAISSLLLIRQNRELLETQEKSYLTRSAQFLSVELSDYLANSRGRLEQLGAAVLAAPPADDAGAKLRADWLGGFVEQVLAVHPELVAVRLLDREGVGRQFTKASLPAAVAEALAASFEETRTSSAPVYRLVAAGVDQRPMATVALPVGGPQPELFVEGVLRIEPIESFFSQEARDEVAVFLVGGAGEVLWSLGADLAAEQAVAGSELVREFVRMPLNLTSEYTLEVGGRSRRMLARLSPVEESGWGVVVHKPVSAAFGAAREMVFNTAVSTAVLVALALLAAVLAAGSIGRPIQRLTETTHDIAAGNFGKRLETVGVGSEFGDLARDFNRMSEHVQQHVLQLQRAAQANRELFIGSMRAFVAAIDAKDPYTRGHSERVAAHSRTIAKFLGQGDEDLHRIWVGALLHDVGKIGVDDRILKKGGVLSEEEYAQMKLHPVIGAQIMSRIEQLREMIPAIRWHHEAWNGRGYPDGRQGEQIPLMARIVAVADTFDAITTNRPYQRAYEAQFAVDTISKLAGSRFDAKVVTAFLRAFEEGQIQLRRDPARPGTAAAASPAAVSG